MFGQKSNAAGAIAEWLESAGRCGHRGRTPRDSVAGAGERGVLRLCFGLRLTALKTTELIRKSQTGEPRRFSSSSFRYGKQIFRFVRNDKLKSLGIERQRRLLRLQRLFLRALVVWVGRLLGTALPSLNTLAKILSMLRSCRFRSKACSICLAGTRPVMFLSPSTRR
jgi:hypothetical protein